MDFIEEQGVSIVANGSFNPAIFQPSWLALNDVINLDESEAAKVDVIHPEISKFQIPGFKFDVQTERFSMHAIAEPFVRAADIFVALFGEKLPHTPIDSIGVNYWAQVRLNDWAQRQRFGRSLAPIEPWGSLGERMESRDKSLAGGFSTLLMRLPIPENGEDGSINVAVQPSNKVSDGAGVFMHVNTHFGQKGEDRSFSEVLTESFDGAIAEARSIVAELTKQGRSA